MKNIFKKLFIPSGEKQTVIAYNSWVVRWNSKKYNGYQYYPESEIFPSKIDADKFADQLVEAFKLLRYAGKGYDEDLTKVTVEANQSKLATITE